MKFLWCKMITRQMYVLGFTQEDKIFVLTLRCFYKIPDHSKLKGEKRFNQEIDIRNLLGNWEFWRIFNFLNAAVLYIFSRVLLEPNTETYHFTKISWSNNHHCDWRRLIQFINVFLTPWHKIFYFTLNMFQENTWSRNERRKAESVDESWWSTIGNLRSQ